MKKNFETQHLKNYLFTSDKMNSEQIIKIVDTIISIRENDKKMQDATDAYFKVMHPYDYEPTIDWNATYALKILNIVHYDIADWLSYFLYEVPWLKRGDTEYDVKIKQNDKEYPLNTIQELKDFLIEQYALDGSEKAV